jgi:hypothetical protein
LNVGANRALFGGMRLPALALLTLGLATQLAACGSSPPPTPAAPETPLAAVRGAKVYDARGESKACSAPAADCPSVETDRELADRCALGGFRMVQCGCEMLCMGDTSGEKRHYNAEGQGKTCAPATPDCSPPQASAAFQDACTEKGHRLEVCGCEWLCSGK